METLEIIIGMVFIYLLVSLLATILQELWASLTSLRGKLLLKAIAKLLEVENRSTVTGEAKDKLFKEFRNRVENSKVYQKYSDRFLGLKQLPSYLSADQVTSIIQELLEKDTKMPAEPATEGERSLTFAPQTSSQPTLLATMVQDDLRKQLNIIYNQSAALPLPGERSLGDGGDLKAQETLVAKAKDAFKQQYDEIMDRATDWYKRGIQWNLIIFGLILAVSFDADTFKIYNNLTLYPDDRRELLQLAQDFTDQERFNTYIPQRDTNQNEAIPEDTARSADLRLLLDSLITNEIQSVPTPLGLGWDDNSRYLVFGYENPDLNPKDLDKIKSNATPWLFFQKIIGWIVTALAISLGAPFWFDLLKKLIQVRNAGTRPQTATEQAKDDEP